MVVWCTTRASELSMQAQKATAAKSAPWSKVQLFEKGQKSTRSWICPFPEPRARVEANVQTRRKWS